jgi:hypothetical protein
VSPAALVVSAIAIAVLGLIAGYVFGSLSRGKRVREVEESYAALKRDFEAVSAVNMQLLRRQTSKLAPGADDRNTLQRFLDLYDEAKRCLHRALDRHNATAPRPIVITRDGANILQALTELPALAFSEDARKDAGLRSWLYRVLELDIERRKLRRAPSAEAVAALERERELWGVVIKQRA